MIWGSGCRVDYLGFRGLKGKLGCMLFGSGRGYVGRTVHIYICICVYIYTYIPFDRWG